MSHPYAGNPANYPSSITLLDDGSDTPDMTNFMTPIEGLADRTAFLSQCLRTLNFQPSYTPPGSLTAFFTGCVDILTLKWLVAGIDGSGHLFAITGYGDPQGWKLAISTSVTAATGTVMSIVRGNEPSVSFRYFYMAIIDSGALDIARGDTTGNAWAQSTPSPSVTDIDDCALVTVPGVIIAAVGAASAAHSNVFFSTDHGATWTAQSALVIGAAVASWLIASNPAGQIVAIPDNSSNPIYITSSNGTTWATQSGLSVLGPTETPETLCWADDGADNGCWVLTTYNGTQTHTYRSTNGTAWTPFVTTIPPSMSLLQMVYVTTARMLVALVNESPVGRVIFSIDGGASWQGQAEFGMQSVAFRSLAASNNGVLWTANALIAPSVSLGPPGGIGGV